MKITHPPNRFAKSIASSLEKLLSSPVKTKASPSRQLDDFGSGTCFEPGADGPANFAAFAAAQLSREDQKQKYGHGKSAYLKGLAGGSAFSSLALPLAAAFVAGAVCGGGFLGCDFAFGGGLVLPFFLGLTSSSSS